MKDTRDKILDVAEEYIQKVGLNAMSYKHISDAVGIRKASIHHHFPKKENLVDELLTRCHTSYGGNYRSIVEGGGTAPEKLRRIAGGFREGLEKGQLCLVGMFGSDLNTLQAGPCRILEATIRSTAGIFATAFRQGTEEGSLALPGTEEAAAFAFFSFLIGAQIAARAHGGAEAFQSATESIIGCWEK